MGSVIDKYRQRFRDLDGIQGYCADFDISARIKKHYCPYCKSLLQVKRKAQIVNSESEEAKGFNFYIYGGGSGGNYKFSWDVFYCINCDKEMSIGSIVDYEKELKKTNGGGEVDFDAFLERRKLSGKITHNWKSLLFACALVVIFAIIVFKLTS